jgi:hypothetical protein
MMLLTKTRLSDMYYGWWIVLVYDSNEMLGNCMQYNNNNEKYIFYTYAIRYVV